VEVALKLVGLQDRSTIRRASFPAASSSGWASRAAIVADPRIIVADEPPVTSTARARRKSWPAPDPQRDAGQTVLMVTHDPHAAEAAKVRRRLDKGQLT